MTCPSGGFLPHSQRNCPPYNKARYGPRDVRPSAVTFYHMCHNVAVRAFILQDAVYNHTKPFTPSTSANLKTDAPMELMIPNIAADIFIYNRLTSQAAHRSTQMNRKRV